MLKTVRKRLGLIYCRVSSKKQRVEGHGLETQEHRCQQRAFERGYPVERVFPDDYTGAGDFMKRPAMKELLEYIDSHPENDYVVIFDDLKRFARDVEFHIKLRQAFRIRNVTIECLNFHFDETPEGKFAELVLAGNAELEREQNKRQVLQKMKARLEKGYAVFCQPTGFEYIESKLHGKILSPKPEARIIQEALEGFANDTFLRQIDVQSFLEKHKGAFKKKQIHLELVKRILTEISYAGYIEYEPWGVTRRKGHHEGTQDERFSSG